MKAIRIALLAVGVAAATQAQAVGVGVRAGTNGIGGDIGFSVAPTLLARVGYSYLNYSNSIEQTDVKYDGKLKLSNASALLDWSPLGPFRITGGFIFNNNKIDVTGTPTGGSYTLNGHVYPASAVGSVAGEVTVGNKAAPYLGIGYGNVATTGVNFYFDLGVMFQGSPKTSLNATCGSAIVGTPACTQLQQDTAAEQAKLSDELKRFQYYPVANIGITVGF
ncbi:hypothetical protein GCM10025771_14910 [Niveibacterium umoris]|uniref:Outer membrane protein beta-barrel domain-containing protein n=1 Tax=Niveibacterium umoris TaxID=1193620 RepID=A0A840BPP2_9RHOO|nr:hypothetical protein [Niveibacterium umoris]MBB4014634.1 hypothetical protein [Niveibacterium umoris]